MIRGALHRVQLGEEKRGHEQRGKRYGVVMSVTDWSMVTIVPTSTSAQPSPFRPRIEIAGSATLLLVDQIRSVDAQYVSDMVGFLGPDEMGELESAVRRYLRL